MNLCPPPSMPTRPDPDLDDVAPWEGALTPRQQRLAASCFYLALNRSGPFKARYRGHADEFESAAMFAVVKAARCYRPETGFAFSTYAGKSIDYEMLTTLEKLKPRGFRDSQVEDQPCPVVGVALDIERQEADGRVLNRIGEPDPSHRLESGEVPARVAARLLALAPRHREVLHRRIVEGQTLEEIGRDLGVTKERVRQIEFKALKRLRANLSVTPAA